MDNQEIRNSVVELTDAAQNGAETLAVKGGENSLALANGLSDNLRALLDKGLHETRASYAKTKGSVEDSTSALEASLTAAREGVAEINLKAIEAMKSDARAHFDLLTSLVSVKSLSEIVTLNTEFVRKRFEDSTARAKSFSEMARKVAENASAPVRTSLAKTMKFAS